MTHSHSQQPPSAALLSSHYQQIFSAASLSSHFRRPFSAATLSSSSQRLFSAAIISRSSQHPVSAATFSSHSQLSSCCGQGLVVSHYLIMLLWSGVGGQLLDHHLTVVSCWWSIARTFFRRTFSRSFREKTSVMSRFQGMNIVGPSIPAIPSFLHRYHVCKGLAFPK